MVIVDDFRTDRISLSLHSTYSPRHWHVYLMYISYSSYHTTHHIYTSIDLCNDFRFPFFSILPFHDMKSEVTSFRKKSLAWIDPDLRAQGFLYTPTRTPDPGLRHACSWRAIGHGRSGVRVSH